MQAEVRSVVKKSEALSRGIIIVGMILIAVICLPLARSIENDFLDKLLNFIRTFIYMGLLTAWGVSVHDRVVQTEARRYLFVVSVLMVCWLAVREFKWRFILQPDMIRYLWYSYYIPILLIPMFALFVAMSLGKSAGYRRPGWTNILYIPTIALIGAVLSNDLHQTVIRFPQDAAVWSEKDYSYGPVFWILLGWGVFCALSTFVIMVTKSRIPNTGKVLWLPLLPIGIAVLQIVLYVTRVRFAIWVPRDLAVFDCLVFTAFFEGCIAVDLIQTNTRYRDLFDVTKGLSVQIVDEDYEVRYTAIDVKPIEKEMMQAAEKAPMMLENGKQLHNMPVNGGHVIWTEDISEILMLRETLKDRQEELTERNGLLQLEYEREKEHGRVREQNRLYDLLQNATQEQIDQINRLTENYKAANDSVVKKRILAHILLLGSYIKRRKDFVLSMYEEPDMPEGKLSSALDESCRAMHAYGIKGGFLVRTGMERIDGKLLTLFYDFFEDVLEAVLEEANYLSVRVTTVAGTLRVSILTDVCTGHDLQFCQKYPEALIYNEEDGIQFILCPKGGAAK